ncbi:hypothetical protein [Proteus phage 10]|uniref:hypothetical protein n=1 Tax=Proteus mirabilis TaxID=584 RepID=UPI0015F1FC45|nr:hypothetical protein [Proteus phage 10]
MKITTNDKLSAELYTYLDELEQTYKLCKAANPGKVNSVIRKKAKEIASKVKSGPIFDIMRAIYLPFLTEPKLLEVLSLRDSINTGEVEVIITGVEDE